MKLSGLLEIGAGEEIAFARSGWANVQTSSSGSLTGRIVHCLRPLRLGQSACFLLRKHDFCKTVIHGAPLV